MKLTETANNSIKWIWTKKLAGYDSGPYHKFDGEMRFTFPHNTTFPASSFHFTVHTTCKENLL
jgi:hypothetical protein